MAKTLEEIRILQSEDLLDEDKKVLKDNWNDLTPEEQDAFKDTVGEPEKKEEDKLPFKTQAELDAYIDAKLKEKETPPDKKEDDLTGIPDIFAKDYKPADWNEAFRTFLVKGRKTITDMTKADLQKEQSVLRDQLKKVNEQIDAEIDSLAKSGKEIPKLGTEERTKLNGELAKIATDYHMDNAPAAKIYELYEMINNPSSTEEPRRKDLARKVSGGGAGGGGGKNVPSYKDIKSKSMDQLLEEQDI